MKEPSVSIGPSLRESGPLRPDFKNRVLHPDSNFRTQTHAQAGVLDPVYDMEGGGGIFFLAMELGTGDTPFDF